MNYSKAIRVVRAAKGLSQKDLGDLTGLTSSYISRIEGGSREPTLAVLQLISGKLEIPFHLFSLLATEQEEIRSSPYELTQNIALELLQLLVEAGGERDGVKT